MSVCTDETLKDKREYSMNLNEEVEKSKELVDGVRTDVVYNATKRTSTRCGAGKHIYETFVSRLVDGS
jgi:hypothetical protein